MIKMKVNVSTKQENDITKQVKINESTRKYTLEIYKRLVESIRTSWELDADTENGKNTVAHILFQYHKKEGKEAVAMILVDDMDIFKDEKKHFRVYAQTILKGGKEIAKDLIKANNESVDRIIARSEKMARDFAKPATAHPLGTGMKRVENEIRHRPRFLAEDIKFKFLRMIGIY
jgi:hypothetical protein